MQIVCPSCSTAFRIDLAALGPAGRSVRCTRCRTVWFATASAAVAATAQPAEAEKAAVATAAAANAADPASAWDEAPAADKSDTDPLSSFDFTVATEDDDLDAAQDEAAGESATAIDDAPSLVPDSDAAAAAEAREVGDGSATPAATSVDGAADAGAAGEADTIDGDAVPVGTKGRRGRGKAKQKIAGKRSWAFVPPALVATLAVAVLAIVTWRTEVVRRAPQTASFFAAIGMPVNLRGLVFENVRTARDFQDGVMILVVEGTIASVASLNTEVPRIRLAIRNSSGHEIYSWTLQPIRNVLAPRETVTFRSRLAAPPADGREVVVRFVGKNDFVTSLR